MARARQAGGQAERIGRVRQCFLHSRQFRSRTLEIAVALKKMSRKCQVHFPCLRREALGGLHCCIRQSQAGWRVIEIEIPIKEIVRRG